MTCGSTSSRRTPAEPAARPSWLPVARSMKSRARPCGAPASASVHTCKSSSVRQSLSRTRSRLNWKRRSLKRSVVSGQSIFSLAWACLNFGVHGGGQALGATRRWRMSALAIWYACELLSSELLEWWYGLKVPVFSSACPLP